MPDDRRALAETECAEPCPLFGFGERDAHLVASFEKLVEDRHYVRIDTLGTGGNGVVVKVEERQTGKYIAIKLAPSRRLRKELMPLIKLRSKQPDNQYICYPLRACLLFDRSWISFPVLACDLNRALEGAGCPLIPVPVREIVSQLAHALDFVHATGIIHTDIKTENVLLLRSDYHVLTRSGKDFCVLGSSRINLTDFGSAVSPGSKALAGTKGLLAPERLFEMPWDTACDMWSLGRLILDISQHEDNLRHVKTTSPVELILAIQKLTGRKPSSKFIEIALEHFPFLDVRGSSLRLAPHLRGLEHYADIYSRVDSVRALSEDIKYRCFIPSRHLLSVTGSLLELDSTKRLTAAALLRLPYMTIDIPRLPVCHGRSISHQCGK